MSKSLANIRARQLFPYFQRLSRYFPSILFYAVGGEYVVKVPSSQLSKFLFFLKNHSLSRYNQLIDISAVDYPERKYRFEVFYNLLSITYNQRLTVTVAVAESMPLDSVTSIYSVAGWFERETWDMFGVFFRNHPDLRRILTDYGFKGHPLRKDFPVTGYVEVRYDDYLKRILYEEVSLAQEFRVFTLENPWADQSRGTR
jgi:NADH-quinone oxidoreductase subunit C